MDLLAIVPVLLVGVALFIAIPMAFRKVVSTNEVHIVQSSKKTTSYGKDTGNGNTYYQWPSWIPFLGVTKIVLPVSVFDLELQDYEAYDRGRLPFIVDVKSFFRISDSNIAAQRVSSFVEMKQQLQAIVQGAVRSILASSEIEEIMQGRSKFGDEFTSEVKSQLTNWGCEAVKNIELMDIRDAHGSNVIKNIMEKKKSLIEMESRLEVAKNNQAAQIAEIESQKFVDVQKQDAKQAVHLRQIEVERQVQLSNQEAQQEIKQKEKITKEKEMEIVKVQSLRAAEIEKEVQIVKANEKRETEIIAAETTKAKTITIAQGDLEQKKNEAEGIALEGKAKAEAEKALQLAPVQAQIELAKEIGENKSYQQYLITVEQVKASRDVGIEQAKALHKAEIKVIANAGTPSSGVSKAMDLFSSQGGTQIGAMLEGLANTEAGKAVMKTMGVNVTE